MMPVNEAKRMGLEALSVIAGRDELRDAFLGWSGLSGDEIAGRAQEPEFLGFVLDFVMQADDSVIEVAGALGCAPEKMAEARMALPGGDAPHWT